MIVVPFPAIKPPAITREDQARLDAIARTLPLPRDDGYWLMENGRVTFVPFKTEARK